MDCRDRILSDQYRDVIVDYPIRVNPGEGGDFCYINLDNLYNLVYINSLGLPPLMDDPKEYQTIPKLYGLMRILGGSGSCNIGLPLGEGGGPPESAGREIFDSSSLTASGITQVQRQPLNLTGRGVVICVVSSGIDYTKDVFRDDAGNSRILAIWDQQDQSGTPPEGFLFGSEYTREEIDLALRSENPFEIVPSRDEVGHGTAMASVAAGSRLSGGAGFLGAAPDVQIVAVKLKDCKSYLRDYYMIPEGVFAFEEQDIMLAVKYADSFADTFRRPVVICLGIGTSLGDHSGNSALSRYLNSIAVKRSRALVVCGGNEGNASHHYSGRLAPCTEQRAGAGICGRTDNYRDVEVRAGENNRGFLMEFWGNIPDVFNIAIRTPGGETVPPLRLGIDQTLTYSFIYERTRITISSVLVEPVSGEELILFRIVEPTAGIWNFRVSAVGEVHNGAFNFWLPITEFLSGEVYFLEPDPYITLTEPSMAESVIGVSAYNDFNNSFYIDSGRGFSRTGAIRPTFAAPGVDVPTVFGRQTGGSLAAAITAGGVAQFMQWAVVEGNNELIESKEVKNYFARGAARSPDLVYPNREWGYGRLDVAGTFDVLAGV